MKSWHISYVIYYTYMKDVYGCTEIEQRDNVIGSLTFQAEKMNYNKALEVVKNNFNENIEYPKLKEGVDPTFIVLGWSLNED